VRTRNVLVLIGVVLVMSSGSFVWAGDDLPALDKEVWQAWKDNDDARFLSHVADDYVGVDRNGIIVGKKALQKALAENPCDQKDFKLGKITVHPIGDDTAILTYEAQVDVTCDGQKESRHIYSSSLWVERGGKWLNVCFTAADAKE
jgi:uncharacterized protein (TIGR02246 family)